MDSTASSSSPTTEPTRKRSSRDSSRSSLSSRLQALVVDENRPDSNNGGPSLLPEFDEQWPADSDNLPPTAPSSSSMWRPRPAAHAKRHSSSSMSTVSRTKLQTNMPPPRVHSPVASLASTDELQETSPFNLPILRWFGKLPAHNSPSRRSAPLRKSDTEDGSTVSSASSSGRSSLSSPPSVLREAFDDDIRLLASPVSSSSPDGVQRPPAACLPSTRAAGPLNSAEGRVAVHRSPPFLGSLTRSTLPTSSVTISLPRPIFKHPTDQFYPNEPSSSLSSVHRRPSERQFGPRSSIAQQAPSRTSIDSLRLLRDRSLIAETPTAPSSSHAREMSSSTSPTRWWFRKEHKASVDNLLHESDQADTIEGEESKIRKRYESPTNPVVFCHGLLGFDSVKLGPAIAPVEVSHWRGIKEVLEANGTEVLITRVPATSSPIERAKVLEAKISETYPGRSVHLIGHSMGGLDCRYLTTHLTHRTFDVLSITTIATPHRGSSFADHFIETLGKTRIPSFVSWLDMLPNGGGDGAAFESLTLESMRRFNEETPDVEGVKYYSWGAVCEPSLVDAFRWPHSVILEKEGPNDGLVSVKSSKWGTYLGTLEDVNHLDLVGWINTARYKWAEFTGREIKFKPATFYLGVADHLARVVERETESDGDGAVPHADEDIRVSEQSRAGEGVKTTEGVEHRGPASRPSSPTPKESIRR